MAAIPRFTGYYCFGKQEEMETETPTQLEHEIMKELSKGRLTPSDLVDRLDKRSPSIVRTLKEMMSKNWVTRVGIGKRAYYSLTSEATQQ